jgi:hypothetical protein
MATSSVFRHRRLSSLAGTYVVSNRLSIGRACFLVHEDDSRSPVRHSFVETTSPLPEPHAIYDASNIRNVVVSNQLIAVLSVTLPSSVHALAVKLV